MNGLAFMDVETTSLSEEDARWGNGGIWEIGLIARTVTPDDASVDQEYEWQIEPNMRYADRESLRVNGYYERSKRPELRLEPSEVARDLVKHTMDLRLVVNNPAFDVPRLTTLVRHHGECPMWDYHALDIKSLAIVPLGLTPAVETRDIAAALGIDCGEYETHTAKGDVRLLRDMYDAVMMLAPVTTS